MKTTFTKAYIKRSWSKNYTKEVKDLSFFHNRPITIEDILESEISIEEKGWYVLNRCGLTLSQKKELTLKVAETVLPIFERGRPEDMRVWECIQATKDYKNGEITKKELKSIAKSTHSVHEYTAYAATYAAYTEAECNYKGSDYASIYYASLAADECLSIFKYQGKLRTTLKGVFKS